MCLIFSYYNFVFSKLKVTNMAHNELPSVILVFGTQLTSKSVKESHVVTKVDLYSEKKL